MRFTVSDKRGFTLVELLTVMAIITLLIGMLVPSLAAVRRFAKETKQRAEFASIEAAITTFKNDYGDYPPSSLEPGRRNYSGIQKLTEALLGRDLMGFHPDTTWIYEDADYDPTPQNLAMRRPRYLDLANVHVFRLGSSAPNLKDGLYNLAGSALVTAADSYVLCDVFGATNVMVGNNNEKAGSPILYYRADRSKKVIDEIYDFRDNQALLMLGRVSDGERHWIVDPPTVFYDYITDPRVATAPYPYRPDSYLLISAGADGLYGTADDIRNF